MEEKSFSQKIVDNIVYKPIRSLLCVLAIILVPIIVVHLFFPASGSYLIQTKLEAGDVLDYLGSITGAIATIVAIIITIQLTVDERKISDAKQKKEQRLAIRPYFQSYHKALYSQEEITDLKQKNTVYITPLLLSDNPPIGSSTSVPKELSFVKYQSKYFLFLYTLRNVGAGNAVDIEMKFNDKSMLPPFSLTVNSETNFLFIFEKEHLSTPEKQSSFSIEFSDVASYARYSQGEKIKLYVDKDRNFIIKQSTTNLLSKPEIIQM